MNHLRILARGLLRLSGVLAITSVIVGFIGLAVYSRFGLLALMGVLVLFIAYCMGDNNDYGMWG